jgi:hypothetical protein
VKRARRPCSARRFIIPCAAPSGFEAEVAPCPEALRPIVGHSVARLVEYQDRSYAEKYLARPRQVIEAEAAAGFCKIVAYPTRTATATLTTLTLMIMQSIFVLLNVKDLTRRWTSRARETAPLSY